MLGANAKTRPLEVKNITDSGRHGVYEIDEADENYSKGVARNLFWGGIKVLGEV